MSVVASVAGIVTKPITDMIGKWVSHKAAKDTLKGKAQMAKQSDATKITLTDAEWETVNQSAQSGTWKDEFVTLCIMYPFVGLFGAGISLVVFQDPRMMEATMISIESLEALGVDIGHLMNVVVYAAVGLKIWRTA